MELPKKHRKGGQSSVRFARLREEKRKNYLTKLIEMTTQNFISNDMPNVEGIILAGNADFKTLLSENLDPRLKKIIVQVIDISYGGENGLNEAITLASEALTNVKFVAEKKLVSKFFEQIAVDTGMVVFGIDDAIKALELSALETIMLYEDIDAHRYVLKHPLKGDTKVVILTPA